MAVEKFEYEETDTQSMEGQSVGEYHVESPRKTVLAQSLEKREIKKMNQRQEQLKLVQKNPEIKYQSEIEMLESVKSVEPQMIEEKTVEWGRTKELEI